MASAQTSDRSVVLMAAPAQPRIRGGRWAAILFVWTVWASLFAVDLCFVAREGSSVPYYDDWELVPFLTGKLPVTAHWLWSPHNEHRIPLPRLVLLALCRLTHGDFRVGAYVNVCLLAALASAMLVAARKVRGCSAWTDVFFPIILLHPGQEENLLWTWQVAFVMTAVLAGIILLMIVRYGEHLTVRATAGTGFCLLLLPLCGAPGAVMAVPLALWLAWVGRRHLHDAAASATKQARLALALAAATLAIVALYFAGLQEPSEIQYSFSISGTGESLKEFSARGFGYNVNGLWDSASQAVPFLVGVMALALVMVAVRRPQERTRAVGLLLFLAGVGGVALAVAVARPGRGTAPRYMTLASLALVACYWTGLLYRRQFANSRVAAAAILWTGLLCRYDVAAVVCICCAAAAFWSRRCAAQWPQVLLASLALLMLPGNIALGIYYGADHGSAGARFEHDVQSGWSAADLAERYTHGVNKIYPRRQALASYIEMLEHARMGPFVGRPPYAEDGSALK